MLDHKKFLSTPKSMLIAPAGFGKTHTIAECLKHTEGKQLILTHTHAGIASIKEKLLKTGIPKSKFHVETITGYAQKYTVAFYRGFDMPSQENSAEHYSFVLQKATAIVKTKPVKDIIKATYSGIFVDEYQDCTIESHHFILALANILPTRILGDYLQGIFGFGHNQIVDMTDEAQMEGFSANTHELKEPWRWKIGKNEKLGEALKEIRELLKTGEKIDLSKYQQTIEVIKAEEKEMYVPTSAYSKKIRSLLSSKSLLVIHPDSSNLASRKTFVSLFNNAFTLIEAIDGKDFYSIAKRFDDFDGTNVESFIKDVSLDLFNKTGVKKWFNEKGLMNKSKKEDKEAVEPLRRCVTKLNKAMSFAVLSDALKLVANLPEVKCYRRELLRSVCKALETATQDNISVHEAMVNNRNHIRRVGRKVFGRCIGTTLLTKGLEFETVVVLNAHKFDSPKHLYVALTRATNRLIVFTENIILTPYPKPKPQKK